MYKYIMNVANIIEEQVLDLYKTTAYQKLKPNVVRTHFFAYAMKAKFPELEVEIEEVLYEDDTFE